MSEPDSSIEAVRQVLLSNLYPADQWQTIESLLAPDHSARRNILGWLLTNHEGYVEVRVRAGTELLTENPKEAWRIIEDLVKSDDPDDRDTALTLLSQNPSQAGYELARPLLKDPWPYLRLEAVEYLKHVYANEVRQVLSELEQHSEEWVRKAARSSLESLG
jgi:HEAT repeat protein